MQSGGEHTGDQNAYRHAHDPQEIHQALALQSSFSKEQTQNTNEYLNLLLFHTLSKGHI